MIGVRSRVGLELANAMPPRISLMFPSILGILTILTSLGGLVAWSCVGSIASAVVIPGIVVVDTGRKFIQHLDGGVVQSLEVREGQEVKASQVLMRLDSAVIDIAATSLERLLALNVATESRLHAEQDGDAQPRFPNEITFIPTPVWDAAKQEQVRLFTTRHRSLQTKITSLKSDGDEAGVLAVSVESQISAQELRLSLTREELSHAVSLAVSGFGTRQRVLEVTRSIAELQGELSNLRSREADARQSVSHNKMQELQASATFQEDAALDLQQTLRDQAELLLKLRTVHQQKVALELRAPVAGKVVNLAVHTVGGVIGPGTTVMELVPDSDPLVLEAKMRPDDIEGVVVGLPINVRLVGVGDQQLPRLAGSVTRVSADRIDDTVHGNSFFNVRAEVAQAELRKLGTHELRAGMPITLMIKKGQQSPLAYLTQPIVSFFSRPLR